LGHCFKAVTLPYLLLIRRGYSILTAFSNWYTVAVHVSGVIRITVAHFIANYVLDGTIRLVLELERAAHVVACTTTGEVLMRLGTLI
jgi:hypothetical protein